MVVKTGDCDAEASLFCFCFKLKTILLRKIWVKAAAGSWLTCAMEVRSACVQSCV